MASWMFFLAPLSPSSEIYSQRVEAPFFTLSGFFSLLGSLRERRSLAYLARTSWKVMRSGLMRVLFTSFFCLSLTCLVGKASVR
jgi:hypothetical protein